MRFIGNILWFIFGGLLSGLAWIIVGIVWCITVIGIPIGTQCFKFAKVAIWPFGNWLCGCRGTVVRDNCRDSFRKTVL